MLGVEGFADTRRRVLRGVYGWTGGENVCCVEEFEGRASEHEGLIGCVGLRGRRRARCMMALGCSCAIN
jgi:hypothetical protein